MDKTKFCLVLMVLGLLSLLVVACRPASIPALTPAIKETMGAR